MTAEPVLVISNDASRAFQMERYGDAVGTRMDAAVSTVRTIRQLCQVRLTVPFVDLSKRDEAGAQGTDYTASRYPDMECVLLLPDGNTFNLAEQYAFVSDHPALQEEVNLRQLVDDTCCLLDGSLRSQRITLRRILASDTPTIYSNRLLLLQVFMHLGLNAVNVMPEGGILTIRAERIDGEPAGARVCFTDTGIGVSAVAPGRSLECNNTPPAGQDIGLGLAVARRITRDCGGEMTIETPSHRGAAVVLTFRAAEAMSPPSLVRHRLAA